ncbi:MAG: epoxyqueuosine reductase QueH [Candidatus Margulisiibacteriota bacterium]
MSKILLHTCCAPCTTYVNKWLAAHDFEVKGFFYNPNIRPQEEYERRLLTMEHYATVAGLKVVYEPRDIQTELGDCENCYRVRLKKTAQFANENGFDCFSTTLLISPYQKHDLLKIVGEQVSSECGVEFFCQDFRQGFRESQQTAREMNLYRQKHCGCGADLIVKEEKVYAQAG